jgi:hypothetical protein
MIFVMLRLDGTIDESKLTTQSSSQYEGVYD